MSAFGVIYETVTSDPITTRYARVPATFCTGSNPIVAHEFLKELQEGLRYRGWRASSPSWHGWYEFKLRGWFDHEGEHWRFDWGSMGTEVQLRAGSSWMPLREHPQLSKAWPSADALLIMVGHLAGKELRLFEDGSPPF